MLKKKWLCSIAMFEFGRVQLDSTNFAIPNWGTIVQFHCNPVSGWSGDAGEHKCYLACPNKVCMTSLEDMIYIYIFTHTSQVCMIFHVFLPWKTWMSLQPHGPTSWDFHAPGGGPTSSLLTSYESARIFLFLFFPRGRAQMGQIAFGNLT